MSPSGSQSMEAVAAVIIVLAALLTTLGVVTCVVTHFRSTPWYPPITSTNTSFPMLTLPSGGSTGMMSRQLGAARDRQTRLASVMTDLALDLPPSIPLPDGEEIPYGSAVRLHIRDSEQESEIYQKCVRAPPNRTIFDGGDSPPPPYRCHSAGVLSPPPPPAAAAPTCLDYSSSGGGGTGSSSVVRSHSMSSSRHPPLSPGSVPSVIIQQAVRPLNQSNKSSGDLAIGQSTSIARHHHYHQPSSLAPLSSQPSSDLDPARSIAWPRPLDSSSSSSSSSMRSLAKPVESSKVRSKPSTTHLVDTSAIHMRSMTKPSNLVAASSSSSLVFSAAPASSNQSSLMSSQQPPSLVPPSPSPRPAAIYSYSPPHT